MKAGLACSSLTLSHPSEGVGTLSFFLPPGSTMVVIGRNGSGKSTLLKTLAGILPVRSGTVTLDSASIASMRPRERAHRLAFVSATPPRGTSLTVSDVMELALEAGGHPVQADRVNQAMEEGGVQQWAQMPLDTLSDGMAQRVMLARAAAQSDALVLLDEPTAFLDVVGRREVMADVARWRQAGKTVIMATHDLDAVHESGWADRWLLMRPPSQGGALVPDEPFTSSAAKALLLGQD